MKAVLIVSSTIAIFTTVGIVFSLLFEAIRFTRLSAGRYSHWSSGSRIRE